MWKEKKKVQLSFRSFFNFLERIHPIEIFTALGTLLVYVVTHLNKQCSKIILISFIKQMGGGQSATKPLPSFPLIMTLRVKLRRQVQPSRRASCPGQSAVTACSSRRPELTHTWFSFSTVFLLYAKADLEISSFFYFHQKLLVQEIWWIANFAKDLRYRCGLCYKNARIWTWILLFPFKK